MDDAKAVATLCRKWKTKLECVEKNHLRVVHLLVDGYFPEKEIRTPETVAAVSHVAAVPKVREWMKKTQRDCIQFGNLVMEGRDIGTNVFPETDYKFYLDAKLEERSARRAADGVNENLAARDQRDSQRAVAPLMIALGAKVINNSHMTSEQTSGLIIAEIKHVLVRNESGLFHRLVFFSVDVCGVFPLARFQSGTRAAERRRDFGVESCEFS